MKKRILSGIFAFAFLATVGLGVNESMKSNTGLSDLALANVEALANNENGDGGGSCYTFQSSSYDRIVCYGGYVYVTTYFFDCNGNNGGCSGIVGSTGKDCQGNPFDSKKTINRNC